jgi:hypothetical protein
MINKDESAGKKVPFKPRSGKRTIHTLIVVWRVRLNSCHETLISAERGTPLRTRLIERLNKSASAGGTSGVTLISVLAEFGANFFLADLLFAQVPKMSSTRAS